LNVDGVLKGLEDLTVRLEDVRDADLWRKFLGVTRALRPIEDGWNRRQCWRLQQLTAAGERLLLLAETPPRHVTYL
jgi:hypothetical protein